jgi:hypothetical protein
LCVGFFDPIVLTDDSIAPIANNDTASTTSTQPIAINVINDDSDTDGSIQLKDSEMISLAYDVQKNE